MPADRPNLQLIEATYRQRQRMEALERAEALRRQAMDDLWRGAQHALATGATQALRSARRWASRLARHRRGAAGVDV